MNYNLSIWRMVRIWLSSNPEVFMPLNNRGRLIDCMKYNPGITMSLVYDQSLLTSKAKSELQIFCSIHGIQPVEVHTTLATSITTTTEHLLWQKYLDEVKNLLSSGNLGAASDILRVMRGVFSLGLYTDFDVDIRLSPKLPTYLPVKQPILFVIKFEEKYEQSSLEPAKYTNFSLNNNVLFISPNISEDDLYVLQNAVILATESPRIYHSRIQRRGLTKNNIETFQDIALLLIAAIDPPANPRLAREGIKRIMRDNSGFINLYLKAFKRPLLIRQIRKSQTFLTMLRKHLEKIRQTDDRQIQKDIDTVLELLSTNIEQAIDTIRQILLKEMIILSVVSTTGPEILFSVLNNKSSPKSRGRQSVLPFSIFDAETKTSYSLKHYITPSSDSDLSWLNSNLRDRSQDESLPRLSISLDQLDFN